MGRDTITASWALPATPMAAATAQAADVGMAPSQRLTRSQVQKVRRRKHAGETQAIR